MSATHEALLRQDNTSGSKAPGRTGGMGTQSSNLNAKRICVIGTGSSGLVALRVIKDTPQFKSGSWDVIAFEARDGVGGVWLPAPTTKTSNPPPTPLYDSLTTNLPHPVMTYTGVPFPHSTPLYPKAHAVLEYLRSYAEKFDLLKLIRLNTSVSDVRWTGNKWKVKVKPNVESSTAGEPGVEHEFEHIIVANGHYHRPYYPSTLPGLDDWRKELPNRITHSVWYRNPSSLGDIGNTVLVIGGGPSGRDIANELAHSDRSKKIIHADPSFSADSQGGEPNLVRRGRVTGLFPTPSRTAYFSSGEPVSQISHILLATGYLLSFPFFSHGTPIRMGEMPPPPPPLPKELFDSQHHLYPLVHDVFPLTDAFPVDKLAFLGLPIRVVPFSLEEAQARAVVQVIANPSVIDVDREKRAILTRYEFLRDEALASANPPPSGETLALRIAHAWFRYRDHEQFTYRNALLSLAGSDETVRPWEIEFYDQKEVLRVIWEELEERGEAEKWVRGVGEGKDDEEAEKEWVEVIRRLIREKGGEVMKGSRVDIGGAGRL